MKNITITRTTPKEETKPLTGLGDLVEKIAKPIAKALHMPCLDEQHKLRPESPCAKRRDALNKMLPFKTEQ